MNILYHEVLCPFSRQVRFYLKELNIDFQLKNFDFYVENCSEQNGLFQKPPILILSNNGVELFGIYSILEYLYELYSDSGFVFLDFDTKLRSEIRKYIYLFDTYFYRDVLYLYIYERVLKFVKNIGKPDVALIKFALKNIDKYLNYISFKLNYHVFLISEKISSADIAIASHISILDYFNVIDWDKWQKLAYWYSLIKSQKGFKDILQDKIVGFTPSKNYSNLDFL